MLETATPALGTGYRMLATALVAALALAACGTDDGSSAVMSPSGDRFGSSIAPPGPVILARAVVLENLTLEVLVDGKSVASGATLREDGLWELTLDLVPGASYTITLIWSESVNGNPLTLAVFTKDEFVVSADGPNELRVLSTQYQTLSSELPGIDLDADDDGVSNLRERRENTLPFDATSPATPPVIVPLTATFLLPDVLEGVGDALIEQIFVQASVGEQAFPLIRDEDAGTWTGTIDVPQNESALVEVMFFSDASTTLALASAERTVETSGNAPSVTFESDDDYSLRDSDADSFSNLRELIDGTRALDASDPPTDPCLASRSALDCDDTDSDGRSDGQGTADADREPDDRPDITEPGFVDDEGDVCVPSTDNDACRTVSVVSMPDEAVSPSLTFNVPRGQLPPPGECRLWYPERPPGRQPPPEPCETLLETAPPGTLVIDQDGAIVLDRRGL